MSRKSKKADKEMMKGVKALFSLIFLPITVLINILTPKKRRRRKKLF